MFGWFRRRDTALAILDKVFQFLDSEAKQNSSLPPPLQEILRRATPCDQIAGRPGEFGRSSTNPIPVNGPIGEILYLSRLRSLAGLPILFHRLESKEEVDIYEVLRLEDDRRELLYLSMYYPRRSRLPPAGYKLVKALDNKNPIFGVNFRVKNFPAALDWHIREWQSKVIMPMPVRLVRLYLNGDENMPSVG